MRAGEFLAGSAANIYSGGVMAQTNVVHTEGADIFYDYQGNGPLLLLISGGGGEAARYARIAPILADEYTVVAYDRRGNSRSTGGGDLDMAQQARDAVAVIRAMGREEAYGFGNSGGAEHRPEARHRPPRGDHRARRARGTDSEHPARRPALDGLHRRGARHIRRQGSRGGAGAVQHLPGRHPRPGRRPGPGDAMANGEFFMAHEYLPLGRYSPDFEAIRRNAVPVVTAAGHDSADAYYARTAPIQAELLGCRYTEFPGHHLSFILEPVDFAEALRAVLRSFTMQKR
jgi:hypothetical protein